MNSILIIMILFMLWAVGYFAYDLGAVIHVLPALALITMGIRTLQKRKTKMKLRGKYFQEIQKC